MKQIVTYTVQCIVVAAIAADVAITVAADVATTDADASAAAAAAVHNNVCMSLTLTTFYVLMMPRKTIAHHKRV